MQDLAMKMIMFPSCVSLFFQLNKINLLITSSSRYIVVFN